MSEMLLYHKITNKISEMTDDSPNFVWYFSHTLCAVSFLSGKMNTGEIFKKAPPMNEKEDKYNFDRKAKSLTTDEIIICEIYINIKSI